MINRRHIRVLAQFRTHFSMKSSMVAGDRELRDLSPAGCRMVSSTKVPLGAELEVCIFPGDEAHPCTIDTATMCWVLTKNSAAHSPTFTIG